ncbi:hypothetical protein C6341_g2870 [Phytophthora cactorum]|nr:hypothetical protein C6341_g2870 [Phytophthora cactorum]
MMASEPLHALANVTFGADCRPRVSRYFGASRQSNADIHTHERLSPALQHRTEGIRAEPEAAAASSDKSGKIRKLQDEQRVHLAASHRWKSIRFIGTCLEENPLTLQ